MRMPANQVFPTASSAPSPAWLIVAWGAMLAVVLPDIVAGWFTNPHPGWLAWLVGGLLGGLVLLATLWRPLWPLWEYLLTLLALVVGRRLAFRVLESAMYRSWDQTAPWGLAVLAAFGIYLIPTMLVTLTLIGRRRSRQNLLLVPGNVDAPAQPPPAFLAGVPWRRLARQFVVLGSLVPILLQIQDIRPDVHLLSRVLINLPLLVLAAAINAVYGEFCVRVVLLGRLVPVVGAQQALWLTTVFYSLWNYDRMPARLIGAILNGFLAWFLGKSVIETRGVLLAFLMHFAVDVVLIVAFALVPRS